VATYLFTYLGRQTRQSTKFETDLFILIATVFLFLARTSSTFYAPGYLGATIFLATSFILATNYTNYGNKRDIAGAGLCLLATTLFRAELILLFPVLCYALLWRYRLNVSALIRDWATYALAATLALSTTFILIRFGIPFIHHGANNSGPLFISIDYLQRQLNEYFFNLPTPNCSVHWSCLPYFLTGSEPGGWLLLRNPLLIISFLRFLQIIFKQRAAVFNKIEIPLASFLPFVAAATMITFYLFCLNNSPRYHTLFTPLLMVSIAWYFPEDKRIRIPLVALSIFMNLAVYHQFFAFYPDQS
jgi:hypothetical protein